MASELWIFWCDGKDVADKTHASHIAWFVVMESWPCYSSAALLPLSIF